MIEMVDPFSTVVAAVSFVDVTIRACRGIHVVIGNWNDAPNATQRLRQTVQNVQCTLESLRTYVVEYESSELFIDHHQLLPEVVKSELRDISLDLNSLQQLLPPVDTHLRRTRRLKWIFDEKKVLTVVRRLDSRQIAVMTVLQSLAQRNGIKFYEQISGIRGDLRQIDTVYSSQLEEAKSTIVHRLKDVTRLGSENGAQLQTALDGIRTSVNSNSDNHAEVMDRLNAISAITRSREGHMQSCNTLQATSTDAIFRMLRAELTSVVTPTVEEHLNSYKTYHNAQLESIRKSLNRIVSDIGHLSVDKPALFDGLVGSQSSAAGFHPTESCNDNIIPHTRQPDKITDNLSSAIGPTTSNSNQVEQLWTLLWRRTWIFHWPIGIMIVHVSLSHRRSPCIRRKFEAFANSYPPLTRYSSSVSINFRPASSFLINRGLFLGCKAQQDQRGYNQISPMLATFAIIPDDAEAFQCVRRNDVDSLRALFDAGLAAPTDRNAELDSLLHTAAFKGFNKVGEFLLRAGADPLATNHFGSNCMSSAVAACIGTCYVPASQYIDTHSFILNLRHGASEFDDQDYIARFEDLIAFGVFLYYRRRGPRNDQTWETTRSLLLSSTSFLIEQGLDVNEADDAGMTTLMNLIVMFDLYAEHAESAPDTVFLLCLLKANVSFREPKFGYQALHLLLSRKWEAKSAPLVMEIAYILIHYGGADISAYTYTFLTPSILAAHWGWWEEWKIVLNRCGYNPDDVLLDELERTQKYEKIGNGQSTAVDTDHILEPLVTTVTRRNAGSGDRLID